MYNLFNKSISKVTYKDLEKIIKIKSLKGSLLNINLLLTKTRNEYQD